MLSKLSYSSNQSKLVKVSGCSDKYLCNMVYNELTLNKGSSFLELQGDFITVSYKHIRNSVKSNKVEYTKQFGKQVNKYCITYILW